tara:strand:+ start:32288 stop:32593 length:306 start_codon:yes stop_codon:yes gene_type:complete
MIDEKIIDIYKMRDRINALKAVCKGKKEYDFSMSGVRIRLIWNDSQLSQLKQNDEGFIELIRKSKNRLIGDQIWVAWDNGKDDMLIRGRCQYELVSIEESK